MTTLVRSLTSEDCIDKRGSKQPLQRVSDNLEKGPKCHSIGIETPIIAVVAPEELDVSSEGLQELHDDAVGGILEQGAVEETSTELLDQGLGPSGMRVASNFLLEDLKV